MVLLKAYKQRRKKEMELRIVQAWHTAAFERIKTLEPLENYLARINGEEESEEQIARREFAYMMIATAGLEHEGEFPEDM